MKLVLLIDSIVLIVLILKSVSLPIGLTPPIIKSYNFFKEGIIYLLTGHFLGLLLCFILSSGYLLGYSDKYIISEKHIINVDTYDEHHLLTNVGPISYVEDIEGNSYSFSYKKTPIMPAKNASYLVEYKLNDFAEEWLCPYQSKYELYLQTDNN